MGERPVGSGGAAPAAGEHVRALFHGFQSELDARHDRYERLVKVSRDITIESKRIIFLLHRVTHAQGQTEKGKLLQQASNRLHNVLRHEFLTIATELKADNGEMYMYRRAYTGGMEEFIEAFAFYTYLRERRLLRWGEVRAMLTFADGTDDPPKVHCTLDDYLMGVSDIAGELMRLALNSISGVDCDTPLHVLDFLRQMRVGFCLIGTSLRARNAPMKARVLKESIVKVERALYTLRVRATEVPDGKVLGALAARQAAELRPPPHSQPPVDASHRQRAESGCVPDECDL